MFSVTQLIIIVPVKSSLKMTISVILVYVGTFCFGKQLINNTKSCFFENSEVQEVLMGKFLGDGMYSLYSIKIIMSLESPKT